MRATGLAFFLGGLALAFALAGAAPARAQGGDFKAAKAAYDGKQFDDALKLLRPLADRGDRNAQFLIGEFYFFGLGRTEKNDAEALRWYRGPADSGHAEAIYRMGYLHATGQGVGQSGSQAAEWWLKAAAKNHRPSIVALGDLYYEGLFIRTDERLARQWLSRAALVGETESMFKLGLNLLRSARIPNDHRRAYAWLYIAAARGHDGAKGFLARNQKLFAPHEVKRGEAWGKEFINKNIPPPARPDET